MGYFTIIWQMFFVPFLVPIVSYNFTIKNSIQFVEEISKTKFNNNIYISSFDVQSLFTNIPLAVTIDICVKLAYQDKLIPNNLSKSEFKI